MPVDPVEVQRLRQMLKASRSLLRELAIACARLEESMNAQPEEAQRDHDRDTVAA